MYAGCAYVQGKHSEEERSSKLVAYIHTHKEPLWQPDWFQRSAPQLTFCNHQTLRKRVKGQRLPETGRNRLRERSSEVEPAVRLIFSCGCGREINLVAFSLTTRTCCVSRSPALVRAIRFCPSHNFFFIKLSAASFQNLALFACWEKKNRYLQSNRS